MIKGSITRKITLIIIAIMLVATVFSWIGSGIFLEKYYNNKKQNAIKKVYKILKDIEDDNDNEISEAGRNTLDIACDRYGASLIVMDVSNNILYDYGAGDKLSKRRNDIIFGQRPQEDEKSENGGLSDSSPVIPDKLPEELKLANITSTSIEKTDEYNLSLVTDNDIGNSNYEMSGTFSDGKDFMISMSVINISESVSISKNFYTWFMVAVMLVTTFCMLILMRSFTKPILKIADISDEMSKLNFDVKYDEKRNDEIGVLGERMNEMSDTLERTISELKAANIELEKDIADRIEIDEMRKEFISNVSHELKTPIALIQGYAEGLSSGITDNPEDMQYYCDVIIDEAAKMNKMVRNLLQLTHLEFSNDMLELEHFDLTSVINALIDNFKMRAEEKGARIIFENNKPLQVWADEFQIEEVITNYISNAINHVKDPGIIRINMEDRGSVVRVSVFNTGEHIPDEETGKIWTKFYKVDKARTREYGGNGIGLSIVKAIMERHGRDYGVMNVEGGVEFWFELDSSSGVKGE